MYLAIRTKIDILFKRVADTKSLSNVIHTNQPLSTLDKGKVFVYTVLYMLKTLQIQSSVHPPRQASSDRPARGGVFLLIPCGWCGRATEEDETIIVGDLHACIGCQDNGIEIEYENANHLPELPE